MKSSTSVVFSVIILLKVISICDGLCSEGCGEELPKRIKKWKQKDYGLEMPGTVIDDETLLGLDQDTQKRADEMGRTQTMAQVNRLISGNKKKGLPDFTINKLDPMSYTFDDMKMLITFSNVELRNLDGYAYNDNAAQYIQKGVYKRGDYEIDEDTFKDILSKKKKTDVAPLFVRIREESGKHILRRRDCRWRVNVTADFVTQQGNVSKPIIIETKFKIQPDKTKNKQNAETDKELLRATGVADIEFHNFNFNLSLDITHIDDPLRPFLNEKIRSDNLVPDFDVEYNMSEIKIKRIRLLPYDGDDNFEEKPDKEENVNDNVPKNTKKKPPKKSQPVKKEEKFDTKPKEEKLVTQHFEVLKELIQHKRDEIKKKLCLNLIPKMAYKVMHMETKMQLPTLFYEIIAYEDDFNEKTKLPPITLTDWIFVGADLLAAKFGGGLGSIMGFFSRSKSAPAKLEST